MKFGEIIKKERKERNMTLQDVGDFVGVHRSTVVRWEKGDIKNISCVHAIKLLDLFNLPLSTLRLLDDLK